MPLIQTLSYSNQNVFTGKNVAFSAVAQNYEFVSFRIFLYELAATSSLKQAIGTITKNGQAAARSNIVPSVTTSVTSVALQSDMFILASGDAVSVFVTSATAGDTANVDIIAELWGTPDLSALITTVDAVVDAIKAKTDNLTANPADETLLEAYISVETAPLASAAAVGAVSSVVNTLPTAAEIDAQLSGTHGAGTWGNGSGSGSISWPITIDDGLSPLDGVDVWVSTDNAGTNVVARGYTDTLGTVTFMLDAGNYYLWKQLSGYTFINPEGITVS